VWRKPFKRIGLHTWHVEDNVERAHRRVYAIVASGGVNGKAKVSQRAVQNVAAEVAE